MTNFRKIPVYVENNDGVDFSTITEVFINVDLIECFEVSENAYENSKETVTFYTVSGGEFYTPLSRKEFMAWIA